MKKISKVNFIFLKYREMMIRFYLYMLVVNAVLTIIPTIVQKSHLTRSPISLMAIIGTGIVIPLVEETMFRALLEKWLKANLCEHRITACLIVAVIFTLWHWQKFFWPYFITSMFLSIAFERSRDSLLVSFLLHSSYNLTVLLLNAII